MIGAKSRGDRPPLAVIMRLLARC